MSLAEIIQMGSIVLVSTITIIGFGYMIGFFGKEGITD